MTNIKLKTKDELIKDRNKYKKFFIVACLVLGIILIKFVLSMYLELNEFNNSYENNLTIIQENSTEESASLNYIKGFVYGILELKYPFFTKLLIFLGIIYLVQVMMSITGDLVQIVLFVCVTIWRGIKGIHKKLKGDLR